MGFLEKLDSQNSPVVKRLTLFYKELMKCHRGFVSEAWAFLIENTVLLENRCKKELSHRFHEDSLIFSQPDKMGHAIQKSFSFFFFF